MGINMISDLKNLGRKFPIGYNFLRHLYRLINPILTEDYFLNKLVKKRKSVFFIQIGAHNGRTDDHLFGYITKNKWHGILVEPVEYLYKELIKNYHGVEGLSFEQKAIGTNTGQQIFYSIKKSTESMPSWYNQLGSFKKDVILKSKEHIPNIEELIVETKVDCITMPDLMLAHQVSHIDLLLIDTEGYDFEIIKSIDLKRINPAIIIYEHVHLSNADSKACILKLEAEGYRVHTINNSNNSVACKRSFF